MEDIVQSITIQNMVKQIIDRLTFYNIKFISIGQSCGKYIFIFADAKNFSKIEQHLTTFEKQYVHFVNMVH